MNQYSQEFPAMPAMICIVSRAGARAVDLGGPSSQFRGARGTKFEIKHKSRCLEKSKLVNWGGGQAC